MGTISSSNSNVRSLVFGIGPLVNLYLTGVGTLATFTTTTNLTMIAGFDCYVTNSSATTKSLTYNTVFTNSNNVYLGGSGSGSITFNSGTTGNPYVYVTNTGGAAISFETGSINSLIWQSGTNAVWSNIGSRTLTIGADLIMASSMGTPTLTPSIIFTMNGSPISGFNAVFVTANKTFVTGTITFNDLGASYIMQVTGNINCNSSITITAADFGIYINGNINQSLVANTLTLTAGKLVIQNGSNVTCGIFSSNNSNARTLSMGWGNWTVTGTGTAWNITTSTNMSLDAQTSRIVFTNTTTSGVTFAGGGLTYYTVEFSRGASTATITHSSVNTVITNFIDVTSTAAHNISFSGTGTYFFHRFIVKGNAGQLITLIRGSINNAVISKLGRGIVSNCDYLNLVSTGFSASPTNTWYAGDNSTGSASGWIITAPPSSQSLLGAGGVG
jgi:hypothetical protein